MLSKTVLESLWLRVLSRLHQLAKSKSYEVDKQAVCYVLLGRWRGSGCIQGNRYSFPITSGGGGGGPASVDRTTSPSCLSWSSIRSGYSCILVAGLLLALLGPEPKAAFLPFRTAFAFLSCVLYSRLRCSIVVRTRRHSPTSSVPLIRSSAGQTASTQCSYPTWRRWRSNKLQRELVSVVLEL